MKTTWNLNLLYKGADDPQIEKDIRKTELAYEAFEKKYRNKTDYQKDESKLFRALSDYENLFEDLDYSKPASYFNYIQCLDSNNDLARAKVVQFSERLSKAYNKIIFFELGIAKIPEKLQGKFLKSKKLSHFKHFLWFIFATAKHNLSESEEKIMNLKNIPSYQMWIDFRNKLTSKQSVEFQGQKMPLSEALQKIDDLPKREDRRELHRLVMDKLESLSDVAEAELNAVVVNKKINDELRGFETAYDQTLLGYQNDRKSVLALVSAVTSGFPIAHRFYRLHAKLLKLPKLEYFDRNVGIAKNARRIEFVEAVKTVRDVFAKTDKKYADILDSFLENGQIDVYPKVGKTGGAFCSGEHRQPTFVLLNYTSTLDQIMTLAHEMGHAIHTELSKSAQTFFYRGYSTSTAEVASTFFEALVFDEILEKVSDEEKIALLHVKISDDIRTIFRQIACFNFEKELHETVRAKGGVPAAELRSLMAKHLKSYMGDAVDVKESDGNIFVDWWHIRVFFYVYSYAFGQLISKALYAKYKENKKFIGKINQFLSAGGSDTPENIFKLIGIDVTKPDFWKKGLASIEKDIEKLEKLTKKK